ncbi:DUF3601 domain-containing protein [Agrobacterium rosae]|uniref:DUF3601 domain-containing protein n=1 Tax=Agrobacterium rosae TaxID=1972867 RepID=A0AAW9F6J4_9HYPH|nr:DUF3601 domain-containing protein [Agrobacterium rosae]MDX8301140.1 DUF3601 domain-containing protein [Agrobacterium rosae]POO57610.1 hypothetical protein CTT39_02775 [Agrobacterium rosae]
MNQEAVDWAKNAIASYVSGHLTYSNQGLNGHKDYHLGLVFGDYYECTRSFKANSTGAASTGERFWFLGCYCFPYDGVDRLFFNDGESERIFEFVNVFPETRDAICNSFKRNPMEYFEYIPDFSGRSDALKMLGKAYDFPSSGLLSDPFIP